MHPRVEPITGIYSIIAQPRAAITVGFFHTRPKAGRSESFTVWSVGWVCVMFVGCDRGPRMSVPGRGEEEDVDDTRQ